MSSKFYYLEPCPYSSITVIVESLDTLTQEINKNNERCFPVEVPPRAQKADNDPANEESGLTFSCTEFGYIVKRNVGNSFGGMLRGN